MTETYRSGALLSVRRSRGVLGQTPSSSATLGVKARREGAALLAGQLAEHAREERRLRTVLVVIALIFDAIPVLFALT